MIKIKVIGGLGNQLFQYAAARSLADTLGTELILDVSAFERYNVHPLRLHKFKCDARFVQKLSMLGRLMGGQRVAKLLQRSGLSNKYFIERGLPYDQSLFSVSDGSTLFGYFQTERYFYRIRQQLLRELVLVEPLEDHEAKMQDRILAADSIALHIRRGDYISNKSANDVHGVCDREYFRRGLGYLQQRKTLNPASELFVFSDDLAWCRQNLHLPYPTTYVEGSSHRPEVDMVLMSRCKHHIISNSTFSWWGAWLCSHPDQVVIAPKQWFRTQHLNAQDVVPERWVRL